MYHKLSIEETLKALDVNAETGLSDKEAAMRISREASASDGSSFFKFAASTICKPAAWLLLVVAAASALLGGFYEAVLIFAVVIFEVLFSARCRSKGKKSLEASVNASVTHAIVLRNGAKMKIPSDELVVGDVVTIKPGRIVPADLRLISSEGLVTDESALGYSSLVNKDSSDEISADVAPRLRTNCAFSGTAVVKGRGDGVVIATGISTELGRLTLPMDLPQKDTSPTFSRINKLSKRMTLVTVISCILIFVLGILRNMGFMETLMVSLALSVAVVPEGIFTAALMSLANGAQALRKEGFSAKSMHAVETLGEVRAFCTDVPKLGVSLTYTNGRIRTPEDEDTAPFLDGLLLCELKNPQLFSFAQSKCNAEEIISAFPRIGELSGEVSTTLHRAGNTTVSYTGGEVLEILRRSELIWEFGRIRHITETDREEITEAAYSLSEEGFSTVALGMRSGDELPKDTGLIFLGIAASRANAGETANVDTHALIESGVRVYLLTESDAEKAKLGASALGISSEKIMSGRELDSLTEIDLSERLSEVFVFYGMNAERKVRVIRSLQSLGLPVASSGDTISDVAALDAADVGLSDVHAQDAAKGAADVLLDGRSGAHRAVFVGKTVRANIKKAVMYLISANLGELICVFLALASGMGFALTPVQLLLLNVITDALPPLAMASGSLRRLRSRSVTPFYIWGAVFGVVSFVCFAVCRKLCGDILAARSVAFIILSLSELLIMLPICSGEKTVFSGIAFKNGLVSASLLVGLIVAAATVFAPYLNSVIGCKIPPMPWIYVSVILPVAVFICYEIIFIFTRKKHHGK